MAYHDPPIFKLASREELSNNWLVKVRVFFRVFRSLIFVSISYNLYDKVDRVASIELSLLTSTKVREVVLKVNKWVSVANLGKLFHLSLSSRKELLANIVLHIHEICNLFNSCFLLEHLDSIRVKAR